MTKIKTTCINLSYALLAFILSPIVMIMVPFLLPISIYRDLTEKEWNKNKLEGKEYMLDGTKIDIDPISFLPEHKLRIVFNDSKAIDIEYGNK